MLVLIFCHDHHYTPDEGHWWLSVVDGRWFVGEQPSGQNTFLDTMGRLQYACGRLRLKLGSPR